MQITEHSNDCFVHQIDSYTLEQICRQAVERCVKLEDKAELEFSTAKLMRKTIRRSLRQSNGFKNLLRVGPRAAWIQRKKSAAINRNFRNWYRQSRMELQRARMAHRQAFDLLRNVGSDHNRFFV